jgi:hypothetical protein
MLRQAPLSEIELILERHSLIGNLNALFERDDDRQRLLAHLDMASIFNVDTSWEHLTGRTLENLKRLVRDIRICAAQIEQLGKTRLVLNATLELRVSGIAALKEGTALVSRLRMYASDLEFLLSAFGPRRKPMFNSWKAAICALVVSSTGRFHDRDVAAIISAVLEEEERRVPCRRKLKVRVRRRTPHHGYTEKAHQKWRRENSEAINDFVERFKDKVGPPPPPSR